MYLVGYLYEDCHDAGSLEHKGQLLSLPIKTQDIWSKFTSSSVFTCTCESAGRVLQDCRPQVQKGSEPWQYPVSLVSLPSSMY